MGVGKMKLPAILLAVLLLITPFGLVIAADPPEDENPDEGWVLYDDFETVYDHDPLLFGLNGEKWGAKYSLFHSGIRVRDGFCEINHSGFTEFAALELRSHRRIIAIKYNLTMAALIGPDILTGLLCIRGVDNKSQLWTSINYWVTDAGEESPWLTVLGVQPYEYSGTIWKQDYWNTIISPLTSSTPFELLVGDSCTVTIDFTSEDEYVFGVEGYDPIFWYSPNQSDLPDVDLYDLYSFLIVSKSIDGSSAATIFIDNVYVKYADEETPPAD
jgi:hypothetical protein